MQAFEIHTPQTAPAGSADILSAIAERNRFLPNVFAVLGGSTPALAAFATLNEQFGQSSLSPIEREIVQTAARVQNEGAYCVAGHSAFTDFQELDTSEIAAVRTGAVLADPRHQALRVFAESLVRTRGRHAGADVSAFLAAGYQIDQVFDVVLGVCVKMFSNIASGVADIPLDDAFAPFEWSPSEVSGPGDAALPGPILDVGTFEVLRDHWREPKSL